MLTHTFLHLPGITPFTERALWGQGITTWEQLQRALPFSLAPSPLAHALEESRRRLAQGDARWFSDRLPFWERWRLFADFRGWAAFLDIETTGLSPERGGYVTVVGVYDGREYRPFIRGHNLHLFPREAQRYRLLVTFNGRRFDLPFLEAEFGPALGHVAHVDLLYPLRRLGLRGGLKRIQQAVGLARPTDLEGLGGFHAVLLWRAYQRGDRDALSTLVRYNAEDTVVLEGLMVLVYNALAARLPLGVKPLPFPPRPPLDLPHVSQGR